MPTLLEQANAAAIDSVKADKPSQFTIGGHYDGQRITTAITYDRKWTNGWGATAYARAWWDDLPVSVSRKPRLGVGAEIVKKF
jgi:hypothetical protein